jgi:hypothetical protein
MQNLKLTRQLVKHLSGRQLVYHATLEDIEADEGVVDHCVWDPPYADRTQDNVRRGSSGSRRKPTISAAKPLGFPPAAAEQRQRWAAWAARAARRWVLVFSDHESSMEWAGFLVRAGMIYVRSCIWVRTGDPELGHERPAQSGAPQYTGDRPGAGHEVIVCAHAAGRRLRWNGGGKHGVYTSAVERGEKRVHAAQKPLALMREILADFCNEGETISDKFCGAGTTGVAAKQLGMTFIGADKDAKWATYAQRRIDGALRTPTHGAPE